MSSEKGKGACVVPDPDRWLSLSNLFNDISSTLIWKFYNIENVTLLIQSTSQCKNNLVLKQWSTIITFFTVPSLSLSHNLEQFEMINVLHVICTLFIRLEIVIVLLLIIHILSNCISVDFIYLQHVKFLQWCRKPRQLHVPIHVSLVDFISIV